MFVGYETFYREGAGNCCFWSSRYSYNRWFSILTSVCLLSNDKRVIALYIIFFYVTFVSFLVDRYYQPYTPVLMSPVIADESIVLNSSVGGGKGFLFAHFIISFGIIKAYCSLEF